MFKFLCAMDQAEYQYWMPMVALKHFQKSQSVRTVCHAG